MAGSQRPLLTSLRAEPGRQQASAFKPHSTKQCTALTACMVCATTHKTYADANSHCRHLLHQHKCGRQALLPRHYVPALASQPPTAGQSSAMAAGNQRLVASQPTGAGQFSAVAAGLEVMWLCWGLHSPQLMLSCEEWRRHSHCKMQFSSHSIDPGPGPAQSPWRRKRRGSQHTWSQSTNHQHRAHTIKAHNRTACSR